MRILDKRLLEQVSSELALLCSDMLELEASFLKRHLTLHEAHRRSAIAIPVAVIGAVKH
jgi:hypothetical protein